MSYYCAACQKGTVDELPAYCPVCGKYLSKALSEYEADQVRAAYNSATRAESERASVSREGFFSWLIKIGLEFIKDRLIDWAWEAIKRFFGF